LGLPRRNVAGIEVAIENAMQDIRDAPFSAFAETSRDDSDAARRLSDLTLVEQRPVLRLQKLLRRHEST
jgi:hypothetical protein